MSAIMADVLELVLAREERERVAEVLLATAGEPDPEDIDDTPSPAPASRTELMQLLKAGAASGPGGKADAAFWAELDAAIREPAAPRRGTMP